VGEFPVVLLRKCSESSDPEKRNRGAGFMSSHEGHLHLQQHC